MPKKVRATWCIIEGYEGRVTELLKAGVPAIEVDVRKPRAFVGVAFPRKTKGAVFTVFGIDKKKPFNEIETDVDGAVLLIDAKDAKTTQDYRIITESPDHLEHWGEIHRVLQEFAPRLKKRIIKVYNPHGRSSEAVDREDELSIRFWSCAGTVVKTQFNRIFDISLDGGQSDGCLPSETGFVIDDTAGVAVAEVVGGTLYVLFDLPHGTNAGLLMRKILEEVVRTNALTAVKTMQPPNQRDLYIVQCRRRFAQVMQAVTGDIAIKETEVAEVSARLTTLTRELEALRQQAHKLEADKDTWKNQMAERFGAEYDKLTLTPHVKTVVVTPRMVTVHTDTIFLEHGGKRYELGNYCIRISSDGRLTITNERVRELTGQTYYQHPHIFDNGADRNVCLGNIGPGIMKLIGSYEYAVAVQILIRFLHTVTSEEPYERYLVTHWKPITKTELPAEPKADGA